MTVDEYYEREQVIKAAIRKYPTMEMGAAARKYAAEIGYKLEMLRSTDPVRKEVMKKFEKPCSCGGIMQLEGICGSCVEGRKGYKTKWTCTECLHRELSKKGYEEWMSELLSKESSSQTSESTPPVPGASSTDNANGSEVRVSS